MSTQSTLVNQPHSNGEGAPPRLASVGSEGERSEPERTTEANCGGRPVTPPPAPANGGLQGGVEPSLRTTPDPEVVQHPTRRRFTANYKRHVIAEADANPDAVGKILRREGLYSSHLATWRKLQDQGQLAALESKKRGPKPSADRPLQLENNKLKRENTRLNKKLRKAEVIIDLQKKVSQILGLALPVLEETDEEVIW